MPVQYSCTSTPPMDRTACTEPQYPLQYSYISTTIMDRTASTEPHCLYSIAIPLLPLWAVRPVQYSYTSTPPMGRTASTEPQCLYSTAIPLLPLWAVRPVQSLSACTGVHFTFLPSPGCKALQAYPECLKKKYLRSSEEEPVICVCLLKLYSWCGWRIFCLE